MPGQFSPLAFGLRLTAASLPTIRGRRRDIRSTVNEIRIDQARRSYDMNAITVRHDGEIRSANPKTNVVGTKLVSESAHKEAVPCKTYRVNCETIMRIRAIGTRAGIR